jgi:hypothetical protein
MNVLEWCQNSALSLAIRHEAWTIPTIEILHLAGVVLVFGSVLVTSLRLFGWIFASEPSDKLAADLARWTRLGLILLVVTGPLLFFAMPKKMFETPDFTVKLVLVAIAATYYLAVHRKRMLAAGVSGALMGQRLIGERLKRSAAISLALWMAAILAGLELGAFS